MDKSSKTTDLQCNSEMHSINVAAMSIIKKIQLYIHIYIKIYI